MAKEDLNNTIDQGPEGEGVDLAKKIVEESEFGSRQVSGFSKYAISIVAAAWSLFQVKQFGQTTEQYGYTHQP